MTLYDTDFWVAIESATADFSGMHHYDHETDTEINIPGRDRTKYAEAYQYYSITFDTYFSLASTLEEINLIRSQIQHSQDFALQHKEFTTDFILSFCYKNWIIRINIIVEQLIFLTNHVYRLDLPDKDLINRIFEHPKIKNDRATYVALSNLVNFLRKKILLKVNTKSIKRARNEIVHNANFRHDTISNLSTKLFEFKMGFAEKHDDEDLYLEEGKASEKIKNEILDFSNQFLDMYLSLYSLFGEEFKKQFKLLTL